MNKREPRAIVQEVKLKKTDRMTSDTFTKKAYGARERYLLDVSKKEILSE